MNRLARIAALFLLAPVSLAADQMIRTLPLAVDDPRPVAAAILELESRHSIAISYEDVPLAHAEDIHDVAADVRRDLNRFAAGQAPPVIVPIGGAFEFTYDADRRTGKPVSLDATLHSLLNASADAGIPGAFRVVHSPGMTHVIPVAAKSATGAVAAVAPVLDAQLALPPISANGIDALDAFCEALSRATGQTIVAGTIPVSLFGKATINLGAREGVARETLVDLLSQVPATVSWQLFYDPGMQFYALNLHVIE